MICLPQRHLTRYHGDDVPMASSDRPASRGGGSGASSVGGASSAASTPSPRPPSSLPSPRPLANPLLSLVGGKLACLYCSRDAFPSLEALQLHLHSSHGWSTRFPILVDNYLSMCGMGDLQYVAGSD